MAGTTPNKKKSTITRSFNSLIDAGKKHEDQILNTTTVKSAEQNEKSENQEQKSEIKPSEAQTIPQSGIYSFFLRNEDLSKEKGGNQIIYKKNLDKVRAVATTFGTAQETLINNILNQWFVEHSAEISREIKKQQKDLF